jgi:SAM-dependent methyltransferase
MSNWSKNTIKTRHSSSYYDNGYLDYFDNLLELNILKKNINKLIGSRVLDLAAGNGRFSEFFISKKCEVNAVDLESGHVEYLRERFKDNEKVKVTQMDAFKYVKESQCKYDIVVISGLLLFFDDRMAERLVSDAVKILNDGGVVIIRDFFSKSLKITMESSIFKDTNIHYRPVSFYKNKFNVIQAEVCRPQHMFVKLEKKLPYFFISLVYRLIYSNKKLLRKSWVCSLYTNNILFISK